MNFARDILAKIAGVKTVADTIDGNVDQAISTTESNIRGADSDTLKSLSDQIDGVGGGGGSPVVIAGACDSGMSGSTTTIVSDDLSGYGDDYFNNNWFLQIVKNDNSVGNAPSGELQRITDYISSTGTFTTDAFSANVEADDSILVIHGSQVQKDYQKYTSGSGNWTVPENVYEVDVIIVGGGAGGCSDGPNGGGGGETVILRRHAVTPGASVAYVVGAGGAGGTSGGPGSAGGNSSFDGITAYGGDDNGDGGHIRSGIRNYSDKTSTGGRVGQQYYVADGSTKPEAGQRGHTLAGVYKVRIGGGGGGYYVVTGWAFGGDSLGIGGNAISDAAGGGGSWGDGGDGGSFGGSGIDGGGGGSSYQPTDGGAGGDGFVKIMWKG